MPGTPEEPRGLRHKRPPIPLRASRRSRTEQLGGVFTVTPCYRSTITTRARGGTEARPLRRGAGCPSEWTPRQRLPDTRHPRGRRQTSTSLMGVHVDPARASRAVRTPSRAWLAGRPASTPRSSSTRAQEASGKPDSMEFSHHCGVGLTGLACEAAHRRVAYSALGRGHSPG